MTEEQIERLVESLTDSIDRRFLRGEWSQPTYDRIMRDLARWAERLRLEGRRMATIGDIREV